MRNVHDIKPRGQGLGRYNERRDLTKKHMIEFLSGQYKTGKQLRQASSRVTDSIRL